MLVVLGSPCAQWVAPQSMDCNDAIMRVKSGRERYCRDIEESMLTLQWD